MKSKSHTFSAPDAAWKDQKIWSSFLSIPIQIRKLKTTTMPCFLIKRLQLIGILRYDITSFFLTEVYFFLPLWFIMPGRRFYQRKHFPEHAKVRISFFLSLIFKHEIAANLDENIFSRRLFNYWLSLNFESQKKKQVNFYQKIIKAWRHFFTVMLMMYTEIFFCIDSQLLVISVAIIIATVCFMKIYGKKWKTGGPLKILKNWKKEEEEENSLQRILGKQLIVDSEVWISHL